jgi:Ca2+-binding EF-hand superfamily protein
LALKQYFEYYDIFNKIDKDGSKEINFEEFQVAISTIENWTGKISDPQKSFLEIDRDGSGEIDFPEFCN